jgi:hypothetical protein
MPDYTSTPEGKDPELWKVARKRASFRSHATTYVIVNLFLWGVWYFSAARYGTMPGHYPWPIWTTLGWGIGLAFHFAGAYVFSKSNTVEKEYEKLKNKN